MSEYIDKWYVVNRLIDLENKFQRLKPFHGNEQDMYEKICELENFLREIPCRRCCSGGCMAFGSRL